MSNIEYVTLEDDINLLDIKPEPIKALSWNELKYKDLKPKEYMFEPLIAECDLTMIYTERGIGKTMVALGIA